MDLFRSFGKFLKGGFSATTAIALINYLPFNTELKTAIGVVSAAVIHVAVDLYNQRKGN